MPELTWSASRVQTSRYLIGDEGLGSLRSWLGQARQVVVATEPDIWALHGAYLRASLEPARLHLLYIEGERDKELTTVERLTAEMMSMRIHRRDKLIALGGGACCDMGGLLAMTYMRGLRYANVPTSLMAQVDAAVGGKVGCNLGNRKNLFGGFYHPEIVVADQAFLATLPERELRAGLAEVLKVALILPDSGLWSLLERFGEGETGVLPAIIESSIAGKLRLLDADPFENDLDRVLNLGHAVAHALEKVEGCQLIHGEAVAVGLSATARYAVRRGLCSPDHSRQIHLLLEGLGLPTSVDTPGDELLARLSEIADHRGGALRLAVPIGEAGVRVVPCGEVPELASCVACDGAQCA